MSLISQNSQPLVRGTGGATAFGKGETYQMTKTKKILAILLLAVMLVGAFTGCNSEPPKSFQSMEDFKHARIGIMTGSSFDVLAKEYLPEADKLYFMNVSDLIMNLKQERLMYLQEWLKEV